MSLLAQVESNSSHYMFKPLAYNTAQAACNENIDASIHYRNQWSNLTSTTLSNAAFEVSYPIARIRSAVSLTGIYDMIGAQRNLYLNVGFSYALPIRKWKLAAGVSGGMVQSVLKGNILRAPDGQYDNTFTHNDPIIPLNRSNGISPYLTAALFLHHKSFFTGISLTNALESAASVGAPNASKNIIFRRNLYAVASYKIKAGKSLIIQPGVLYRTDFKKMQLDYSLIFNVKKNYYVGIGYRGYNNNSNESVMLLLGLNFLKNVSLLYSYDINTSRMFNYQYGSHEVTLKYSVLPKKREYKPKIIYNPRFL